MYCTAFKDLLSKAPSSWYIVYTGGVQQYFVFDTFALRVF